MGSQDQAGRKKTYNDPDKASVEQYSLDYMRSLRSSAPEEMLRLWRAGHFTEAMAEEAASRADGRTYTRSRGTTGAATREWAESRGVNLDDVDPNAD
ncbi:hypothetical protein SCMC78_04590 [Streptomyces sp. CMC78]|uniref:Uncharacterized protein n=1 Tax=Streptomyces sp. CMC78 TaxID=3231512 RepID=A0AB33K4V9_9ACTN